MVFLILILLHLVGKHGMYDIKHMEFSEGFYSLKPCYIKCSPWTSTIVIQRIVKKTETQTLPHILNQNLHFNKTST